MPPPHAHGNTQRVSLAVTRYASFRRGSASEEKEDDDDEEYATASSSRRCENVQFAGSPTPFSNVQIRDPERSTSGGDGKRIVRGRRARDDEASSASTELPDASDLDEIVTRPSSRCNSNPVARNPRLADVVDTLNGLDVGSGLRRTSVIRSAMSQREVSPVSQHGDRTSSSERSSSYPRSHPPPGGVLVEHHRHLLDVVGQETRKRISPLKSCLSSKSTQMCATSESGLDEGVRWPSAAGMAKWKYPRNPSFIVDMNNPPKRLSPQEEPPKRRKRNSSNAPESSSSAMTPPLLYKDPRQDADDQHQLPAAQEEAKQPAAALQEQEKKEELKKSNEIYYPSRSPFRKQVQQQQHNDVPNVGTTAKAEKMNKALKVGALVTLVVVCVVLYCSLLGEVISIHQAVNLLQGKVCNFVSGSDSNTSTSTSSPLQ